MISLSPHIYTVYGLISNHSIRHPSFQTLSETDSNYKKYSLTLARSLKKKKKKLWSESSLMK